MKDLKDELVPEYKVQVTVYFFLLNGSVFNYYNFSYFAMCACQFFNTSTVLNLAFSITCKSFKSFSVLSKYTLHCFL